MPGAVYGQIVLNEPYHAGPVTATALAWTELELTRNGDRTSWASAAIVKHTGGANEMRISLDEAGTNYFPLSAGEALAIEGKIFRVFVRVDAGSHVARALCSANRSARY